MKSEPNPGGHPRELEATLDAAPSAAGQARRLVVQALAEWGLSGACEAMRLVVSELVTNSVTALEQAVPDGPSVVRLRLTADLGPGGSLVTVQVWDQAPCLPVRQSPGAGEENGRGLLLVEAVSQEWGYYQPAHPLTDEETGAKPWPGPTSWPHDKETPPSTAKSGKVTWAAVKTEAGPCR
ncbi:ATP-binding protein [Actinomadura craniellae]|uniref:ATP-binding protein n=1 Tax=Actinomadura craniellae TaxID=2231787 RepID=UPI001314B3EC|nr:ATP-binding protein [Actinomadura craniellae]